MERVDVLVSIPSHILISGGWQLSREQAGTCITANERQWVCTLITFQQPAEKEGQETGREGESRRDRERKIDQEKSEVNRFFFYLFPYATINLNYFSLTITSLH